jgi:uncharacterized membrane protein SpoIIM required for sporulation
MKRPLSLTIIAWVLIVISVFAVLSLILIAAKPELMQASQQPLPSPMEQAWTALGVIITLIVAYGIFKGLPWSRVLCVAGGIIGAVVSFYTSPKPLAPMIALVVFIAISAFLFTNRANEWFSARGFALKRES